MNNINQLNEINMTDARGNEADVSFLTSHLHEQNCLSAHHAKNKVENQPNFNEFDGKTCVDCGDNIPEARLAMQRIRCVDCQEVLEKNQLHYSRLYA